MPEMDGYTATRKIRAREAGDQARREHKADDLERAPASVAEMSREFERVHTALVDETEAA